MEDLTGLFVVVGIIWFIIALIVGSFGKHRTIGFAGAFYASLLLSPILGMLFVLASDKKADTGLSSGERVAIYLPLGLIIGILLIGGIGAIMTTIADAKWEEEYAITKAKEKLEKQKIISEQLRIADSLSKVRYNYWQNNAIPSSKPITKSTTNSKPKEVIPVQPDRSVGESYCWTIYYNDDKSLRLSGIGGITILENEISELVTIFQNTDKLIKYCEENSVPKIERIVGSINQYNIVLDYNGGANLRFNDKTNEYNRPYIYDFNCNTIISYLTTKRDKYYKQLDEYNAYKLKKEQEVDNFALTLN